MNRSGISDAIARESSVCGPADEDPQSLAIAQRFTGECIRIELTGGLDAAGAERFEQAQAELTDHGPVPLLLDLGGLNFVDSAGLRSVLRFYGACLKLGRDLRIVPAPAPVQRVFALTRAADVLPFAPPAERPLLEV